MLLKEAKGYIPGGGLIGKTLKIIPTININEIPNIKKQTTIINPIKKLLIKYDEFRTKSVFDAKLKNKIEGVILKPYTIHAMKIKSIVNKICNSGNIFFISKKPYYKLF
tara:strand:- start:6068 stop:6394 length:327 start_codon:yes stop_codon:yes gene_type:complete